MNKNDDDIEMPTDIELALAEYLGTPEGAALAFEIGEERTMLVWLAGYRTATDHFYSEQISRIEKKLQSLSLNFPTT